MIHWPKPNEIHNFNHPVSWCEQSQWLIFEVINPNKDLRMLYAVGICGWIFFIRALGLGTCLTLSPFVHALFLFASPVARLVKVGTRSELRQERHIVRRRECRCKSLCVANPKHSPANSQPVASPKVEMLSVCLYHREALDIGNHIDSCYLNNLQSIPCSNMFQPISPTIFRCTWNGGTHKHEQRIGEYFFCWNGTIFSVHVAFLVSNLLQKMCKIFDTTGTN